MNSKWKLSSLSVGLAAALATVAAPAAQAPGCAMPQYSVRDLGVLGKGTNASAFDMNGAGWVAGLANRTDFIRGELLFQLPVAKGVVSSDEGSPVEIRLIGA